MKDILVAFGRAGRSLGRRDMFWHLLWPGLLAVVIWAGVAFSRGRRSPSGSMPR